MATVNPVVARNSATVTEEVQASGTQVSLSDNSNTVLTANSAAVIFGRRIQLNHNSTYNMTTGGYLCPVEFVLNTAGTGTHDKAVGQLTQLNLTGGNLTSVVGVESEIASLGASTLVSGYAAFFVPNLAGLPNVSNISQFGSFICQHVNSYSMNYGQTLNGQGIEIAPPYHPGLVAGRYYTAPHDNITTQAMAANIAYAVPIYIPERLTTGIKLGFTVTTGAGNARISLWTAKGGTFSTLVAQSGSFSVATTGDKEQTLSPPVIDAGCYYIVAVFDSTPTLNWHSMLAQYRVWQYGAPASNTSGAAHTCTGYMPFTFGAFPSSNSTALTYQNIQIEPHFWFRK